MLLRRRLDAHPLHHVAQVSVVLAKRAQPLAEDHAAIPP